MIDMYETEANIRKESLDQIPPEITASFRELKGIVAGAYDTSMERALHGVCVAHLLLDAAIFTVPEKMVDADRFSDGMVRVDCPGCAEFLSAKDSIQAVGKLWTPGNIGLRHVADATRVERRDYGSVRASSVTID